MRLQTVWVDIIKQDEYKIYFTFVTLVNVNKKASELNITANLDWPKMVFQFTVHIWVQKES